MNAGKLTALAVAIVALLVIGACGVFYAQPGGTAISTSHATNSTGNSKHSSAVSTWTTRTTCASLSTTSQVAPTILNGSFTYYPTSPIEVQFVKAIVYYEPDGSNSLVFEVTFRNVGNSAVYVAAGCGGPVSSSIVSGANVVEKSQGGPRCLCAEFISPLNPGENRATHDPGCWSEYRYGVMQPGTFTVDLTLQWWPESSYSSPANTTSIRATFTFAFP